MQLLPRRRSKLWEIPNAYHCELIGTCISMPDLRRHARRAGVEHWDTESDYCLHHTAVRLAGERNTLSQLLHKALETRYELAVRASQRCRTPDAIQALWTQALEDGEIAGFFWAVMSHAHATPDLREHASHDVHMLSHQARASSRADLRRLKELEREAHGLRELLERQRRNFETRLAHRAQETSALERRAACATELECQLQVARARLAELQDVHTLSRDLSAATSMAQRAGEQAAARAREVEEWKTRCSALERNFERTQRERDAAEGELQRVLADSCGRTCTQECVDLGGRRVLCVGGRTGSVEHYRALVERWRGGFVHHDGGLEQSANQLHSLLGSADAVICAAANVSHGAYYLVKRFCKQSGKPCVMLRGSGLASFLGGLQALATQGAAQRGVLRASADIRQTA
jgi:hypothetical protein